VAFIIFFYISNNPKSLSIISFDAFISF